jgi:hypothetical protein
VTERIQEMLLETMKNILVSQIYGLALGLVTVSLAIGRTRNIAADTSSLFAQANALPHNGRKSR